MAERPQHDAVEQAERTRVQAHELSWLLRALIRASAELDQDLAHRLGLRPLDYAAMNHVMTSGQPVGPVELSARLGISTGSGTELVDRLENAGHLHRERHPSDRRRVVLQATDTAVARILETLGPILGDLDDVADDFTPAEQATVARYLRAVEQCLHRYNGDDTRQD